MTWPIKKITDVCDLERGTEPGSAFYIEASDKAIPFLRVGDLSGKVDAPKFVKNDNNGKLQIVNKNETLITFDGTPGIVVRGLKGAIASGIRVVKNIKAEINGNFLFYYLRTPSVQKIIKAYSKGATIIHASSAIEHIKIPLPPLAIQKQIVERLDKISEAQKLNDDLIQKSDELFQSLLHRELNSAGKNWEAIKLREVCDFYNGQAHEKYINENGNYVVINSKFIASNGIEYKKTNNAFFPLLHGDITMVMSDVPKGKALAKCFFVDKNDTYTLNQRICAIRSKNFENKFLYYQLNRNRYFLRFDNGQSQTNLRKDDILDCPLFLPPLKIQKQIVAKLSAVQDYKKQLLAQKSKLKELFDSVLAKSMSGKLVK